MSNQKYQNSIQDQRITSLEKQFSQVCQNYNEEIGGIKVDIASIKANQKITLGFVMLTVAALVGLFFK